MGCGKKKPQIQMGRFLTILYSSMYFKIEREISQPDICTQFSNYRLILALLQFTFRIKFTFEKKKERKVLNSE